MARVLELAERIRSQAEASGAVEGQLAVSLMAPPGRVGLHGGARAGGTAASAVAAALCAARIIAATSESG